MNVLLHDPANKAMYIAIIRLCASDGTCTGSGSKQILIDLTQNHFNPVLAFVTKPDSDHTQFN